LSNLRRKETGGGGGGEQREWNSEQPQVGRHLGNETLAEETFWQRRQQKWKLETCV
jgi:hypothetical protein